MRKIIPAVVLCILSVLSTSKIMLTKAYSAENVDYLPEYSQTLNNSERLRYTQTFNSELPSDIHASSAYLCDFDSQTLVYAKNENDRKPIASMTKIMLLILAFEKEQSGEFSLDEKITVSANASGMGGSQVFLEADGEYLAGDLIKSIIVSSANDSSVAIAERLFGSETAAVEAMNNKAHQLGLHNTLFSNCTGLTKPTQYSSAKDVAIMLSELIKYDKYFNYSKIYLDEICHANDRKTQMTNTNKLIKFYNGCDGGKTGFTNEAGFCLAATAKRGATRLISVVIGEQDGKVRFADACTLFNYGFDNYMSKCVLSASNSEYSFAVKNGRQAYADALPENDIFIFRPKNKKENLRIVFQPFENKAPLKKGDKVGVLTIFENDIKIGDYNAVCGSNVDKLTFIDYIKRIAKG